MINADMGPLDTRGRAIAHFFFNELEKIAREIPGVGFAAKKLRAPGALREMGQFESNQARRSTDAMGFGERWLNPRSWGIHSQASTRSNALSGEMQKNVEQAKGVMANKRASPADREAAISYLEAAKAESPQTTMRGRFSEARGGEVAPDFARQQELSGATRTGDFAANPKASPLAQKAKMIGGGLAVGAAGTVAGQQYLQHKSNQTGGYGGY